MIHKKEGFKNQRAIVLPEIIRENMSTNQMTQSLYITDIGYYPAATSHYIDRRKGSQEHILIHCVGGQGTVRVEDTSWQIGENEFIIIEAGRRHSYYASDLHPWSIYWIHFTGNRSHVFKDIYNRKMSIDPSTEARMQERIILFEEIYRNLEFGYSNDNLEYTTACLWHYLASFRFIQQFRAINRNKDSDFAQKAIVYMKSRLADVITLDEIATEVNYSPSYFGQKFRQQTGFTPLEYFNQLKIQKACQELDFSDKRIKEIAADLGFFDQYHFSKVFLKHMSQTPTQYKNRKKG